MKKEKKKKAESNRNVIIQSRERKLEEETGISASINSACQTTTGGNNYACRHSVYSYTLCDLLFFFFSVSPSSVKRQ